MNPAPVFAFTCPVKTNSGNKALEHLPVELAGLNAFKPLIITSLEAAGQKAIRTLTDAFGDSGMTMGLFDGITDAADLTLIENLKTICIKEQYDAVIALGGGTIVDAAKVLNLASSLPAVDSRLLAPETPIRQHLRPLVVIPTAQADGLEASKFARLNRMTFSSEYLAPNLVVIDPRLIRAKEGKTIAATGLAALGRALEAHISADKNPFRDAYSFAAISFIRENLPAAVKNPGDKKAALAISNAAAMSGCAFSNTETSLLHKLGQVFSDLQHIPPGIIIGMCLPHVLGDYLKKDGYNPAALLQPLAGDDEFVATPAAKRADAALSVLGSFLDGLHNALGKEMPSTLRDAGIPDYMMEDILEVLGTDRDGPYLRTVVDRIWNSKPVTRKKG
jgi:alcohol dehydrogenase